MKSKVEVTENTLKITRTFNAPREVVFAAWSDPKQLEAWACCAQATSMTATVDFRVGGIYRTVMQIAGVQVVSIGTYTEIEIPKRIAYTLKWEPFKGMDPMPETKVIVDFIEGGKQTEVRLTHSGLVSKEMKENVTGGWQESFDKLANRFAV